MVIERANLSSEFDQNSSSGRKPWSVVRLLKATALAGVAAAVGLENQSSASAQDKKFTIALIPGLTTDAFYITMRKGAQAAADALGVELVFQGAPDFNPVTQVPVLDAVIARAPSAILIAPTDTTQLVEPLRKANDAGIPVITVDTFIGTRQVPDRRRRCRLPALLHRFGQRPWRSHGGARARCGDRRRRQGLCLKRQAWHLDHRPARGRLQALR